MCQTASFESEQIDRYIEQGMPKKIIKTVKHTMRKRAEEHRKECEAAEKLKNPMKLSLIETTSNWTIQNDEKNNNNNKNDQIKQQNYVEYLNDIDVDVDVDVKNDKDIFIATNFNDNEEQNILFSKNATIFPIANLEQKQFSINSNAGITTTKIKTTTTTAAAAIELPIILNELIEKSDEQQQKINEKKFDLKIPKLCGRFRQQQQQQLQLKKNAGHAEQQPYIDMLAMSTQLTKKFANRFNQRMKHLQNTKIYTLLTTTTQPAHFIAICILSFVLLTVWPELTIGTNSNRFMTTTTTTIDAVNSAAVSRRSNLAVIAYLGAFATHFGAQIWMTFISGLSLYFSLPRHTFGQCQQILFPKYFALNSVLSIFMLILYIKYFLCTWNISCCVQIAALTLTAIIEVTVRLYLAPPMLRLMHEKYKIEDAIGSGQEVGSLVQGDLIKCPHYQRIHKSFRRIHMTIAIGNIAVLLSTCLHLCFLASKIQIS